MLLPKKKGCLWAACWQPGAHARGRRPGTRRGRPLGGRVWAAERERAAVQGDAGRWHPSSPGSSPGISSACRSAHTCPNRACHEPLDSPERGQPGEGGPVNRGSVGGELQWKKCLPAAPTDSLHTAVRGCCTLTPLSHQPIQAPTGGPEVGGHDCVCPGWVLRVPGGRQLQGCCAQPPVTAPLQPGNTTTPPPLSPTSLLKCPSAPGRPLEGWVCSTPPSTSSWGCCAVLGLLHCVHTHVLCPPFLHLGCCCPHTWPT
jgi:hypothetical protein